MEDKITLNTKTDKNIPQSAAFLAYAGSLPTIIAAICIWLRPDDIGFQATTFLLLYAGVLVAFFGGVRWGIAILRPGGPSFSNLLGGIWPLLIAIPLLMLDDVRLRFLIIIIALPILLWDDLRSTQAQSGAPEWYLGVRFPLTVILETGFILALLGTIF